MTRAAPSRSWRTSGVRHGLLPGALVALVVTATAACSGGSGAEDPPRPSGSATGATGATGTASGASPGSGSGTAVPSGAPTGVVDSAGPVSGGTEVGGTSYRFTLPTDPAFEPGPEQVTDNGTALRSWRWAVADGGPYCFVTASEQPRFAGDFPGSTQAIFAGRGDRTVLRNDPITPAPNGTVAGLDQQATLTVTAEGGQEVPTRLVQRTYLTPGGTLIQLSVAGPQEQAATCQLDAVAASLRTTGADRR